MTDIAILATVSDRYASMVGRLGESHSLIGDRGHLGCGSAAGPYF